MLPRSAQSPDLSQCDFHLFGSLKDLGGQQSNTSQEVMEAVQFWLRSQAEEFFAAGIHKFPFGGPYLLKIKDSIRTEK